MGQLKTNQALEDHIPCGLDEYLQAFLATIDLEKGMSKHSINAYEKDLAQFAIFLDSIAIDSWSDVDCQHISLFLTHLNLETYSVASVARKLSALRMFARFLVKENYRKEDFSELLSSPKKVRKLPGMLTINQVDALLNAPNSSTPQGIRDKAIFELMYSSGMRVSELCGLSMQMIDLENGYVRVFGKNAKERGIPVGQKAIACIRHYLLEARPKLSKRRTGSDLFISQWGRAISRKTVWYLIKEYTKQVGITKNVKPHTLRHSFASHLLQNGANLRAIQEMLGHADISTTEIYTNLDQQHLTQAHALYHPRNRKKAV